MHCSTTESTDGDRRDHEQASRVSACLGWRRRRHRTTPSSIAAAARHTMAAALAPPRSTRSANETGCPRYSTTVAGLNMSDSRNSPQIRPFTSPISSPASSRAARVSSAHCSMVNCLVPVYLRTCSYSAIPTIAADPASPNASFRDPDESIL